MDLYNAVILALLVNLHEAEMLVQGSYKSQPLKVAELAELIQKVAHDSDTGRQAIDMDYFSTDFAHRSVLNSVKKVLGNDISQKEDPEEQGVRIHIIKNPQVLEEYKEVLRRRHRVRSTGSTPNPWGKDSAEPLSDLSSLAGNDYPTQDENEGAFRKRFPRRNDDPRDERSNESKRKSSKSKKEYSSENEKVIHSETKGKGLDKEVSNDKEDKRGDSNERKNMKSGERKDIHVRASERDSRDWDKITKKWKTRDERDRKTDDGDNNRASEEKPKEWNKFKNSERKDKKEDKHVQTSERDSRDWDKVTKKWRDERDWKRDDDNNRESEEKPRKWDKFKNNSREKIKRWKDNDGDVAKAIRIRESMKEDNAKPIGYNTVRDKGYTKKKSYVPKIADYYQPSKQRSHSNNYGRTSIPFVGKKGIYED